MTRVLLALFLVLLPLLTACDSYVEFTVVNATDAPIKAGWSYTGCPRSNGPPPRLRESEPIAPRSELKFTTVSGGQAKCIMITNEKQTVRLYQRYVDGARFTVSPAAGQPGLAVEAAQSPTVTP